MLVGAHGTHLSIIDEITTPARVGEDFFRIERTHRSRGAPIPGGQTEGWILWEGRASTTRSNSLMSCAGVFLETAFRCGATQPHS
jgi:hypothetical protein